MEAGQVIDIAKVFLNYLQSVIYSLEYVISVPENILSPDELSTPVPAFRIENLPKQIENLILTPPPQHKALDYDHIISKISTSTTLFKGFHVFQKLGKYP